MLLVPNFNQTCTLPTGLLSLWTFSIVRCKMSTDSIILNTNQRQNPLASIPPTGFHKVPNIEFQVNLSTLTHSYPHMHCHDEAKRRFSRLCEHALKRNKIPYKEYYSYRCALKYLLLQTTHTHTHTCYARCAAHHLIFQGVCGVIMVMNTKLSLPTKWWWWWW